MCIHFLLIVFTTMEVLLILESQSDITRSQERVFYKYFFNEGDNFDELDHQRYQNFFDVATFRQFVT